MPRPVRAPSPTTCAKRTWPANLSSSIKPTSLERIFVSQPFPNQPVTPPIAGGPVPPGGYGQTPFAPPSQQKSRWWMYLLGGCGCSGVLLLLCCGGGRLLRNHQGRPDGWRRCQRTVGSRNRRQTPMSKSTWAKSSRSTWISWPRGKKRRNRGGNGNWLVLKAKGEKGDGTFIVQATTTRRPKKNSPRSS